MKELIKISEMEGRQVVSARELHEVLEVRYFDDWENKEIGSRYNDWIRNRIKKYGFVENVDYITLTKFLVSGGKTTEYGLTIGMAKELAMVENNEKGRAVRKYFIEMEKKVKQPLSQIDIIIQSAQLLKANAEKLEQHDDRINRLEAKQTTRREDLFTVAGWGTLKGIPVNMKMASSLGRKAAKMCRDRGIDVDSIPDPRFGRVNVYPEEVLEEVFQMPLTG
jgi:phage anti-repressor protein